MFNTYCHIAHVGHQLFEAIGWRKPTADDFAHYCSSRRCVAASIDFSYISKFRFIRLILIKNTSSRQRRHRSESFGISQYVCLSDSVISIVNALLSVRAMNNEKILEIQTLVAAFVGESLPSDVYLQNIATTHCALPAKRQSYGRKRFVQWYPDVLRNVRMH